jgi:non-specific serine/threonine protein kinase
VVPLRPLEIDDASTLFLELAAARGVVLRDDVLPSVHAICRRLDGLPLAIELVAARLVLLPPMRILQALDEGLALDMEGPIDLPERQRTLRAAIDWSFDLLTESQRELLSALAVFAGGCTLDDAQTVARSGSTFLADLEALVGWSLLRSDVSDGDVRLSMLETVRENALARLAEQDLLENLRRRHAERFLELAATAEEELAGPAQRDWLDRLETELDNLRAALDWCFASARVEDALRAIASLERFWRGHGHVSEARRWLSLGLELAEGLALDVRADALWTAAQQATAQYDWAAAEPLLEEALELFRESGRGRETVFALSDLGFVTLMRGETERSSVFCERALAVGRDLDDARAVSAALMNLGDVRSAQGEHDDALRLYDEAVVLRRELGDPLLVADAVYNLGVIAFRAGDLERAREACTEALAVARDLGEAPHVAAAQFTLAEIHLLTGAYAAADEAIRESLALYAGLENALARAGCLVVLAGVAAGTGSFEEGALRLGAADALRGGAALDEHQHALLSRIEPELEEALGSERLDALRAEGGRLGGDLLEREVVTAKTAN